MDPTAIYDHLHRLAERDSGLVAALGRSLAMPPGTYAAAFPALERLLGRAPPRARAVGYLLAGLWARYGRRAEGTAMSLPAALKVMNERSGSVEARLVALLDADEDELEWRLRQAVALVSGAGLALDWPALHRDVLRWHTDDRAVQQRWARQFYAHEAD